MITENFRLKMKFAIISENIHDTFHILVNWQTRQNTLLNVYINLIIAFTTKDNEK